MSLILPVVTFASTEVALGAFSRTSENATNTTLTVAWETPSGNLDHFVFEVGTDPDLVGATAIDTGLTASIEHAVNANETLYYRVTAYDEENDPFVWTNAIQTVTTPPEDFVLAAIHAESTVDVDVSWGVSTGASGYEYQTAHDSAFSSLATDWTTIGGTELVYSETPDMASNASRYFRVRALNAGNYTTMWSGSGISGPHYGKQWHTLGGAPSAFARTAAVVNSLSVELTWSAATAADGSSVRYKVHWGTSSGVYTANSDYLTDTEYVMLGLDVNTQYYYCVVAYALSSSGEYNTIDTTAWTDGELIATTTDGTEAWVDSTALVAGELGRESRPFTTANLAYAAFLVEHAADTEDCTLHGVSGNALNIVISQNSKTRTIELDTTGSITFAHTGTGSSHTLKIINTPSSIGQVTVGSDNRLYALHGSDLTLPDLSFDNTALAPSNFQAFTMTNLVLTGATGATGYEGSYTDSGGTGTTGEEGAAGVDGNPDGQAGGTGGTGDPVVGGTGGNGSPGVSAVFTTLDLGCVVTNMYIRGGDGGVGGVGGGTGNGGDGGTGGNGGDGYSVGLSNGGDGGDGGSGGSTTGGTGGNGGNGGDGGHVTLDGSSMITNLYKGGGAVGAGGAGGAAGAAGVGGFGGTGGTGYNGGSNGVDKSAIQAGSGTETAGSSGDAGSVAGAAGDYTINSGSVSNVFD